MTPFNISLSLFQCLTDTRYKDSHELITTTEWMLTLTFSEAGSHIEDKNVLKLKIKHLPDIFFKGLCSSFHIATPSH